MSIDSELDSFLGVSLNKKIMKNRKIEQDHQVGSLFSVIAHLFLHGRTAELFSRPHSKKSIQLPQTVTQSVVDYFVGIFT